MNDYPLVNEHLDRYEVWEFEHFTDAEAAAFSGGASVGAIVGVTADMYLIGPAEAKTAPLVDASSSRAMPAEHKELARPNQPLAITSPAPAEHHSYMAASPITPPPIATLSENQLEVGLGIFGFMTVAAVAATSLLRYLKHRRRVNFTCEVPATEMEAWLED